jgi:lysine 2,3-aminomutase
MPNYLVSASDDAVVLRNYEGMLVRYQAEDKPNTVQPTKTRGVSSLLQGNRTLLMPEQNERMARRQLQLLAHSDEHKPSIDGNGHNCCEGNGREEALVALNTAGD